MIIKAVFLMFILFAAASNCLALEPDDKTLATVYGRTITLTELMREITVRGSAESFRQTDPMDALHITIKKDLFKYNEDTRNRSRFFCAAAGPKNNILRLSGNAEAI